MVLASTARDARLVPIERDMCVPEDFYSTTNHRTEVRLDGVWRTVGAQRMDAVIVREDRVVGSPGVVQCSQDDGRSEALTTSDWWLCDSAPDELSFEVTVRYLPCACFPEKPQLSLRTFGSGLRASRGNSGFEHVSRCRV